MSESLTVLHDRRLNAGIHLADKLRKGALSSELTAPMAGSGSSSFEADAVGFGECFNVSYGVGHEECRCRR